MQRIDGVVQHYDWGDQTFLPSLLQREPDGRPWAELWLGTHPAGPATFDDRRPLADVTDRLPFLLKVLAVAHPLSLQTHPDAATARDGYERGRFADPYPKPELLCAVTPFTAFCGFRPVDRTLDLLTSIGADELAVCLRADGTRATLAKLLHGDLDHQALFETCRRSDRPEAAWVDTIADEYPGDPAAAATLLLNLVELQPGEAIRLDAGNLHAYVRGVGVELMGASDNVVRAGLTPKPVDVDLLLDIVDTDPLVRPELPAASSYELPAAGAELVRLTPGEAHTATGHEIAIDLAGGCWYLGPGERLVAADTAFVARSID